MTSLNILTDRVYRELYGDMDIHRHKGFEPEWEMTQRAESEIENELRSEGILSPNDQVSVKILYVGSFSMGLPQTMSVHFQARIWREESGRFMRSPELSE